MFKPTRHRSITRVVLTACMALAVAACSAPDSTESSAPVEETGVPIIEGLAYYVGGPAIDYDRYGRGRLRGFNGEVVTPSNRGAVFGARTLEDGKYEYYVWLNGDKRSYNRGFLDEKGLLWFEYREKWENGKLLLKQYFDYDDAAEKWHEKTDYLDPDTGEIIQTGELNRGYVVKMVSKDKKKGDGAAKEKKGKQRRKKKRDAPAEEAAEEEAGE